MMPTPLHGSKTVIRQALQPFFALVSSLKKTWLAVIKERDLEFISQNTGAGYAYVSPGILTRAAGLLIGIAFHRYPAIACYSFFAGKPFFIIEGITVLYGFGCIETGGISMSRQFFRRRNIIRLYTGSV